MPLFTKKIDINKGYKMSFSPFSEKPSYIIHKNGYIMSSRNTSEIFEPALTYTPKDDDVFIVTYPKCGTTWAQCILQLMKNFGKPLETGQNINHFIPHLENDGKQVIEQLPTPRVIKTHLPFWLVPKNRKAKYIYIARNPKDCCVSFYHHTKGFKAYHFEDGTFDEYFKLFLEGKVDSGDYFDNLLSWIEHKNDSNVLFLLYEDMKSDTVGCIKKIGNFLGGSYQKAVEDHSVMENVLKYSNFDTMKQTPAMWASQRPAEFSPFIRKGTVGDSKNYFSEEQARRLDKKFKTKLSGTEAEFLWKEYDC